MLALLLSCQEPALGPKTSMDTTDSSSQDTADTSVDEPELLPYSGGTCPALVEGLNQGFLSGETPRQFRVILPESPQGAGLAFAWHWLGGNSRQMLEYMELQSWADDHGLIVIAPDASGSERYEWSFTDGPNDNPDALFFDDMLACAQASWGIDLERVHTVGMSAGGLWTTWLTLHRAEAFASTAPLSGGLEAYVSPSDTVPVLITWGGPEDTYNGFSFADASQTLSTGLQGDGHFVVECVHDGGHDIPPEATEYVGRFFADHVRGERPDPYTEGLPAEFPSWCTIPG